MAGGERRGEGGIRWEEEWRDTDVMEEDDPEEDSGR